MWVRPRKMAGFSVLARAMQGMRNGMTPRKEPSNWWFPLRGPLGSFHFSFPTQFQQVLWGLQNGYIFLDVGFVSEQGTHQNVGIFVGFP